MNNVISYDILRFARGYLIVPQELRIDSPVLEQWTHHQHAGRVIFTHPESNLHVLDTERGESWILLGHAYDPWSGVHDEDEILASIDAGYRRSDEELLAAIDRLSGRFVLFHFRPDGTGMALQDAVGMKNLFFAASPQGPCFASHSQLLADALGLERDPAIDRLVKSGFYGIGIRHLPGLRTPFRGMRMLSANTLLRLPDLTIERFFPRGPHPESADLAGTARIIGDVFSASFDLLSRKKPLALSLSTGTDSRVSLAASRKHKDRIHYFSYISDAAEERDATGAHELCGLLGVDHTIEHPISLDT